MNQVMSQVKSVMNPVCSINSFFRKSRFLIFLSLRRRHHLPVVAKIRTLQSKSLHVLFEYTTISHTKKDIFCIKDKNFKSKCQ